MLTVSHRVPGLQGRVCRVDVTACRLQQPRAQQPEHRRNCSRIRLWVQSSGLVPGGLWGPI